MSVVDSSEHFIDQSIDILNDVSVIIILTHMKQFLQFNSCEDDTMLPLISITAMNLLLCLLQRSLHESTDISVDSETCVQSDESNEDELRRMFYTTYAAKFIPSLLKVIKKFISYGHTYICRNIFLPDHSLAEDLEDIVKCVISVSSSKFPLKTPVDRHYFASHIPGTVLDQLKSWNASLLLDSAQIEKVSLCQFEKINLLDEFNSLLTLSLNSFASHRTFDPTRLLKTTLNSALTLLLSILNLSPQESTAAYLKDVVPFATDLVTEFTFDNEINESEMPLHEIASLFDADIFNRQCIQHKVSIIPAWELALWLYVCL